MTFLGQNIQKTVSRTQAVLLLIKDLKSSIPTYIAADVRLALNNVKLPNLSGLMIPLLRKKKSQKETILADSWVILTSQGIQQDSVKLVNEVLTPAYQNAIESCYFEVIHWKAKIKKVAGMLSMDYIKYNIRS